MESLSPLPEASGEVAAHPETVESTITTSSRGKTSLPSHYFHVHSLRSVPPIRQRMEKPTSEHMLPTSTSSRNKNVFSSRFRLVKRNLPFFQSKNILAVANQHSAMRLWTLLQNDWFHVFLRLNLMQSLIVLLGLWTLAIILWARVYMWIDKKNLNLDCGLGPRGNPIQFGPAFAFSLETCTTVGYGLPNGSNAFFGKECHDVIVAIYFQLVWSMLFNAFLFAFFFTHLAKSEARGIQVSFSDKAIICHRPETPYPCFQFRLFDIDSSHPVVEAHVRLYAVSQRSPIPMPLRLIIPNDEFGGMLFLSLPSQVVHAMDAYSPLTPNYKDDNDKCLPSAIVPSHGLNLRQVDSSTNMREEVVCPVCGESYGTVERLIHHGKFNTIIETQDEIPVKGSHREVDWDEWEGILKKSASWTIPQLKAYFRSSISEIICVVEGIDPLASGTFQALQSYQIDDIHFGDAHFTDCVCLNAKHQCVVDLDYFHRITTTDSSTRADELHQNDENESSEKPAATPGDSVKHVTFPPPTTTSSPMRGPMTTPKQQESQQKHGSVHPSTITAPAMSGPTATPKQQDRQPPSSLPPASLLQTASLTPSQANDDANSQLEPRQLLYNVVPAPKQKPTPQAATPPSSTPLTKPAMKATPPKPAVSSPSPAPSDALSLSALAGSGHNPKPRPRRFSAPTEYEKPPPLFVLDDDLVQATQTLPSGQKQPTGKEPGSSSMPSNMMNSLVTGKF